MIYLVDNYDSFVYNLARYLRLLGQQTIVHRHDAIEFDLLQSKEINAIVISPGPCSPDEAGKSLEVVGAFAEQIPILGICLGHQAIVQELGGKIVKSSRPMHGRTSQMFHDGKYEFAKIPSPFGAARYHSLIADPKSLPDCLEVSAKTEDGTIMAVRHRSLPVVGWQFHPESILTDVGFSLLAGFLDLAGVPSSNIPSMDREKIETKTPAEPFPSSNITF